MRGIFIIISFVMGVNLYSQTVYTVPQEENILFGAYANISFNNFSSSFSRINNIPNCCSEFHSGSGTSDDLGVILELPFSTRTAIVLRGGIHSYSGVLASEYTDDVVSINDTLRNVLIEHRIDARLYGITFEPMISYRLIKDLALFGGLNISYLFIHEFKQKEILLKPEKYGTFENGLRTRNEYNGEININQMPLLFITAGFAYDLELNKKRTLFLSPEVIFNYGLTSIIDYDKWKVTAFRIGFAIKYRLESDLSNPVEP